MTSGSPLARRRRWAWIGSGVALLLAFGCGMALQHVRSPAQAALDASAPGRTVLTAQVERTVVQATMVGRGTVGASAPVQVPMPAPTEGGTAMISATPVAAGQGVSSGDVLAVVSGRPVIVLTGGVPAYRDLRPGDEGEDVRQFQQALAGLGHEIAVDGVFGEQTKAAVRWLYDRAGFQVPSTTGLGEPADPEVAAAQEGLRQARRQVTELEQQIAQASSAAAAPEQDEEDASQVGDTGSLTTRLVAAREDVAVAQTALSDATRVSGPVVPMSELAFVSDLPAQLVSLGGGIGATPEETLATLSAGELVISGSFEATQAARITEGMAVTWQDETSGTTGTGTVAHVTDAQTSEDGTMAQAQIVVTPDEEIPGELSGANLRITITLTSSEDEVLAVPIAAITASADGSTYVIRQDESGDQTRVVVTTGVNGEGLVEIAAVDGELAESDEVVTSQ